MKTALLFFSLIITLSGLSQPSIKGLTEAGFIRGTWLTNVGSEVLRSKENIEAAVELCHRSGVNTIFMVVWNKGLTMYPSEVVQQYIGQNQDPLYKGRDPLKEMIHAAHQKGIAVHAWFEFGFAYNYGDSSSVWSKRYPDWVGRKNDGSALQKNRFFWWNGLHPEVQAFMTKLVMEVVQNYEVDGIQGDDRLPAMPSEGGYDPVTVKMYAAAHHNQTPPADHLDSAWMQWRANQLNNYIKKLYTTIKQQRPSCMVTWAPSIFPWSKEQYLQDWPSWLKEGYADRVFPQLYRYDSKAYEKILIELKEQVPAHLLWRIAPGILTSLGDGYQAKPELINQMIQLNRLHGFNGEVSFYFETLRRAGSYYK